MAVELRDLIGGTVELVSLPEVVARVCELISDPRTSAADIGQVIAEDPGLSARLLKVVNSPFYGFPSRIDTISRAVTVIGTMELLDLILATTVVKLFRGLPNHLINMDEFWRHSLYSAVVARIIATRRQEPNAERVFVGGILHDIGSLVIYHKIPDIAREILSQARREKRRLHEVEEEVLGFDHAAVGGELLRQWRLPASLEEIAEYHHRPGRAKLFPTLVAVVHVADVMTTAVRESASGSERVPPLDPDAWEQVGFPIETLEEILDEADVQFDAALGLVTPEGAAA